jgi:membrane-associated phospholipid phosphatase
MALELFRKIDSHKGLLAVEKAALGYCGLTSVLIWILSHSLTDPLRMLVDRGIIVVLLFLLVWLYRFFPCKGSVFVRICVKMSFLSYWYPDTYEFNRLFPNLDSVFAYTEHQIFGQQPSILFAAYFPQEFVSEAFNLGYFFYYPMLAIVSIFYLIYRFDCFEKITFIVIFSFFIYYFIYIFVPVAGPQYYFPVIGLDNINQGIFPAVGDYFTYNQGLLSGPGYKEGVFYKLVEISQKVGERPTAAFPSSHVGISTILMILAWQGNKKLFVFLFPFYLLLCGATVYIQAHYVIDLIAGFVSAVGLYVCGNKLFDKWMK